MGNAAAVHGGAERARRRLLLQQHLARPDVLASRAVLLAFQRRQAAIADCHRNALPLTHIFDVLSSEFHVKCCLDELPFALELLGCRLVESDEDDAEWYAVEPLVEFVAPRRVLRQVKRPVSDATEFQTRQGVTVWQAAKAGDLSALRDICGRFDTAFLALDAFENTPLYYASLCGREAAVGLLMDEYSRSDRAIPEDEMLRCVTNALNISTRGVLQRKLTVEEALALRAKEQEEDDEDEGGWFGLLDEED